MEESQRVGGDLAFFADEDLVSILVLMEESQRVSQSYVLVRSIHVSILVLMEESQRAIEVYAEGRPTNKFQSLF